MKPRRKTGILLAALMVMSAVAPLLATASPSGDGGEDRQGDPLGVEELLRSLEGDVEDEAE